MPGGFTADDVDKVLWRNPVAFYGQSDRLELDQPGPEERPDFMGNSIRRGGQ